MISLCDVFADVFAAGCVQRCMGDNSVYAVSTILAWWPSVIG